MACLKQVDDRDLKTMHAETAGFVMLDDSALVLMSAAALDSHVRIAMRADAPITYIDRLRELGLDADIEEKHVAYDDVGFEISGGGRGRSLAVPLDWCDNDEWKDEYKQIEGKQAQVVRDHAAKKITELETENGIFNTPVRLKYHLENDKSDPEYDLNCKFDSKIQFKWQI